ncbi:MAG: DUF6519 domain-containing protein [Candidatus Aminicenantes bacterium]|jgi:hypothetical protein
MKGDFSRSTFKKKKHFHDVRMQQGRVQLDADWNEQLDITGHRVETETKDVVGLCGTPMHHGGFRIFTGLEAVKGVKKKKPDSFVPVSSKLGNLFISKGRMYVDGILCVNEQNVPFTKQPDLPMPKGPENVISKDIISKDVKSAPSKLKVKIYLAYIDVWFRHITALEDPEIREKALGGPDTATRVKTVWQVKLFNVDDQDANCLSVLRKWREFVEPVTGKLAAYAEEADDEEKPCVLSPEGGYRRLENQLYRVEIHRGGELNEMTFKWSRDNGSIVTKWEEQDGNKLTVSSTGRDDVLNFNKGHWVELTDDTRELLGKPGILVQLENVEGLVLTIDENTIIDPDNPVPLSPPSPPSVDIKDFNNPKVRRWDSLGEIPAATPQEGIELEDGVWVKFLSGTYQTGDYWLIPARTANADVEWPPDQSGKPLFQPPHGIHHHYCPLALLTFDGKSCQVDGDCRRKFPPVTELTNLFYISGDGQEAMPPANHNKLRKPLQVGVSNGQWPVPGAKIKFRLMGSGGSLNATSNNVEVSSGPGEITVLTDDRGVAECEWELYADITYLSQQVEATLLDADENPFHLPIRFTANLSVAQEVYYDPKDCGDVNVDNVQDALERLSKLTAIFYVGGDGQVVFFGQWLPKVLQVRVTNKCGPVSGAKVKFKANGNGRVSGDPTGFSATNSNTIYINTGPDGIAGCYWKPEKNLNKPVQELNAELESAGTNPIREPKSIRFTANLSIAENVYYKPNCDKFKNNVTSVQDAIDGLCSIIPQPGGGCAVTIGTDGQYQTLHEAFEAKKKSASVSFCLLPGIHLIEENLDIQNMDNIKITGCGPASVIKQGCEKFNLSADHILLRDFELQVGDSQGHIIMTAADATVDGCKFERHVGSEGIAPLVLVQPKSPGVIHWKNNYMDTEWKEYFGYGFWELIKPDNSVNISDDTTAELEKLTKTNIYKNDSQYKAAIVDIAKILSRVSKQKRSDWGGKSKKSKKSKINQLPEEQQEAIQSIYSAIKKPGMNVEMMTEALTEAAVAFIKTNYSTALALHRDVGGWIVDNKINGPLSLNFNGKYIPLGWNETNDVSRAYKKKFVSNTPNHILTNSIKLLLHGNTFYTVQSNASSIMEVVDGKRIIDHILDNGQWPKKAPPVGYESLTVTDNVFLTSNNSFVCGSIIMKGNLFNGTTGNSKIAAFVYAVVGIIIGNSAPFIDNKPNSLIEVILENTIPGLEGETTMDPLNFLVLV